MKNPVAEMLVDSYTDLVAPAFANDSKMFGIDKELKRFYAEASDVKYLLQRDGEGKQRCWVLIRSHKTGRIAWFVRTHIEQCSGEDAGLYVEEFRVSDYSLHQFPNLEGWTLKVFND